MAPNQAQNSFCAVTFSVLASVVFSCVLSLLIKHATHLFIDLQLHHRERTFSNGPSKHDISP